MIAIVEAAHAGLLRPEHWARNVVIEGPSFFGAVESLERALQREGVRPRPDS